MHPENCFITLTYSNKHLPDDYSVHTRVWQLFMKRLRKSLGSKKIRSFACGEYGDDNLRPHYHALLFNHSFPDQKLYSQKIINGQPKNLYTSELLSKLWTYGFSTVAPLTYQTAAYTARYIMKKVGGDPAAEHYTRVHPLSGKLVRVQPEFATQSRSEGLGSSWYDKFSSDVFPSDFLVVDGKKHPVPKFYSRKLQQEALDKVHRARKARAQKHKADNSPERLAVRETVQQSKLNRLKREL